MKLTEFGKAANGTGFSPGSCRAIITALRKVPPPQLGSSPVGAFLLKELAGIPEQSVRDVRTEVEGKKKTQFPVKPADFEFIIEMWLGGYELDAIFGNLPFVLRSKRSPTGSRWLEGQRGQSDWDTVYDKFLDFMHGCVEQFLPWVMRACANLVQVTGGWGEGVPWRTWASMVEFGVDTEWAVAALDGQAPAGRAVVSLVGQRWPARLRTEHDPLGSEFLRG